MNWWKRGIKAIRLTNPKSTGDPLAPVLARGPFAPDWESLRGYRVPEWYQDAKLGIFIHWGVYAVPAFGNEWYPRHMYLEGAAEYQHHRQAYGPQDRFGYKDFIPRLGGEQFDAAAWVELFCQAGARYIVPVAEHHDGFSMFDSAINPWNAARMGPRRDVLGELAEAARQRGLVFGLSNHRAEHWWYFNGGRACPSDVRDRRYESLYGPAVRIKKPDPKSRDWQPRPDARFLEDWLARCVEQVERYRPQVVWFDWWIEQRVFEPYLRRFAAYYYNRAAEWGLPAVINYKNEAFPEGTAVLDIERGQHQEGSAHFWQTDTSLSRTAWGYIRQQEYRSPASLLHALVDIVSKNGALLLNVGPRPDGSIPEPEQELLREIGDWLAVNGEAIYHTRPWRAYGEGPVRAGEGAFTDTKVEAYSGQDVRFTTRGGGLYATALGWPGRELLIRSLSGEEWQPHAVRLLGCEQPLAWQATSAGLRIELPERAPGKYAFVFKIERG